MFHFDFFSLLVLLLLYHIYGLHEVFHEMLWFLAYDFCTVEIFRFSEGPSDSPLCCWHFHTDGSKHAPWLAFLNIQSSIHAMHGWYSDGNNSICFSIHKFVRASTILFGRIHHFRGGKVKRLFQKIIFRAISLSKEIIRIGCSNLNWLMPQISSIYPKTFLLRIGQSTTLNNIHLVTPKVYWWFHFIICRINRIIMILIVFYIALKTVGFGVLVVQVKWKFAKSSFYFLCVES